MAVFVLFVTIFLDFVGFSILIPVLPLYLQKLGSSGSQVGLILALYIIGLVLFLPLWGWISDRVGRRPVLLACLIGTAVSFVLLAVAGTLGEFCLARILGGFFGASVGTAQAYMTDITDERERTEGLGIVGAAVGAGMVFGPALGGILEQLHTALPFYAPAALALVNFGLAAVFLPESRPEPAPSTRRDNLLLTLVPTPFLIFIRAHDNRTRMFLYLFFHLFAAFSALEAMFPLYASQRYEWSALGTGLFLGYVGVVMGLTQGILVGRLARLVGEVPLVIVGLMLTGVGMMALVQEVSVPVLALLGLMIAVGNGLTIPTFTSLFSKACTTAEDSGVYLAHSQSMAQTGRGVGFLWGGWALEHIGLEAPFLFGGLGVLAALVILLGASRLIFART